MVCSSLLAGIKTDGNPQSGVPVFLVLFGLGFRVIGFRA